jgi:hypothetical protein
LPYNKGFIPAAASGRLFYCLKLVGQAADIADILQLEQVTIIYGHTIIGELLVKAARAVRAMGMPPVPAYRARI